MHLQAFQPAPVLRPYVDGYGILSGNIPAAETITLLPDGGIHLVLNMGEPIQSLTSRSSLPPEEVFLVGTLLRCEVQQLHGEVRLFIIRFHPGGFTHFFDAGMLNGLHNRFDCFDRRHFPEIRNVLFDFPRAVDWFLLSRMAAPRNPLREVAKHIEARMGRVPLEALARRHGYSERTLEREFRKQLGVTPVEFINLNRFRQALRRIQAPGFAEKLSDIAFDCGYYDQAHMAREFRRFAGVPPSDLILSE